MVGKAKAQGRHHLPVGVRQVVLGERLLHAALDPLVDAADAVDERLDLEIDVHVGQRLQAFQEAVDVILLAIDVVAGTGAHDAHILTSNLLTSRRLSSSLSISRYLRPREGSNHAAV